MSAIALMRRDLGATCRGWLGFEHLARILPLHRLKTSDIEMPIFSKPREKKDFVERLAGYVHSTDTLFEHHWRHLSQDWASIQYPIKEFAPTPRSSGRKRAAVAVDCEMVIVYNPSTRETQAEIGRLSAVDVLTGEALVDALVDPMHTVSNWRRRISGLSNEALRTAKDAGTQLRGWRGARRALWRHINDKTILVGHALNNDLRLLRMRHDKVVDTHILTRTAMATDLARNWSLQKLSLSFLRRIIQDGPHCSTEDALAAAHIVRVIVSNPGLLELWAKDANRLARGGPSLRSYIEDADARDSLSGTV
jgi:hypothetical protein